MTLVTKSYLFSGWIENFGVEPLFLSAAFLLLPIFLSFIFLLAVVIFVFEAILSSLFKLKNQWIFLTLVHKSVKAFLTLLVLLITLGQIPSTYARSIFLSKGEQESIKINKLSNFSIGNPEVISVKYQPEIGRLLIKAKSVGYSDLILWQDEKQKIKYEIYSNSKINQMQRLRIEKSLVASGLKTAASPSSTIVSGKIQNNYQYQLIQKIWNKKGWSINTELTPKLRNRIVAKIYETLLKHDASYINCTNIDILFSCQYRGEIDGDVLKLLGKKYILNFKKLKNQSNYQIHYQIVQINDDHSSSYKIGIDELKIQLQQILNSSVTDLNQFLELNANQNKAKVIASPMIVTGLNENNWIQLGSSLPFQNQTQFGTTTQWKFAGLKVKNVLTALNDDLSLKFQTELSHPANNSIIGSKAHGKITIKLNQFMKAFEITYESNDKTKKYLPFFGNIPILKHLFSSNSNSKGLKHIIGFIKVNKDQ